jgi:hypothetical protein
MKFTELLEGSDSQKPLKNVKNANNAKNTQNVQNAQKVLNSGKTSVVTKIPAIDQAEKIEHPVKATKKNLKQYPITDILRASNIKIKNIIPSNEAISIELYEIPDGIDIILRDINYYVVGNTLIISMDSIS